ncbi:MAG: sugar ABC transporter permease [Propionibacteriaceae bacterium]|nr:sugar ABC transporter permease [Propionibacteriaceae bacterium]
MKTRTPNHRRSSALAGTLFLLPALLVVSLLLFYPVVSSIYYSFTNKHLTKSRLEFVGLANYQAIFTDPDFLHAFLVSVNWTLASLAGQILVGFTAALALHRIQHLKGLFRTLLIIPWAFPPIVIAMSWKWILNGVYGFLPNLLMQTGLVQEPPEFFSSPNLVFPTLVCINIWFGAPLIMVNVLSALQTIPRDQYEAAQIDAATSWRTFRHITLPHIRVVVGLLVVLRTIWVFNNFDTIYLLTGGGPANLTQSVPIYAYDTGWGLKQLGRSSAVTVVLLGFLMIVTTLYFRLLNKWEKEAD